MKKKLSLIIFLSLAGIFAFNTQSNAQSPQWCHNSHHHHHHLFINRQTLQLNQDMRKLWEDHITWTRNVIFNFIDGLPGTNEAVARLLQNQVDIGNAIKPYYGNAAGDQLTGLLTSHILIAANLLTALTSNDTAAFSAANTAWYQNADSIALFLSAANPFWHYQDMHDMMFDHLDLTTAEVVARSTQDYAGDVTAYENVHLEILDMADMLTMGLIHQFPGQFHRDAEPGNQEIDLSDGEVILNQNVPNPVYDQTVITYYIPDNVNQAKVMFYNMSGKLIRTVNISTKGEGTITVNTANLSKGVYTYSIVADDKVIDSKKMIH
jgi:hypothetical protein